MSLYPIFLRIEKKVCVVIGAGEVALRKIESLRRAGAIVKVIAPEGDVPGEIEHIRRPYASGDLEGASLVIAATDDEKTNREVFEDARSRNIPVNVVDKPPLCTFFVPSVVERGDLRIAISTGGKCPALAKKLRKHLEEIFGEEYGAYVELMEKARQEIIMRFPGDERKRRINEILDDPGIMSLVREKRMDEARERVSASIEKMEQQ